MTIKNVVIVGAGAMGAGIAQIAVMGGYRVTLVDIKQEYLNKGIARIGSGLEKLESKGQLRGYTAAEILDSVKRTTDLGEAVKDADLVLEAVVEVMKIKQDVFRTLGENAPDHCVLVSNTSSMSISEIADASGCPERVCGVHFFNPPILMRLVEVIRGEKSSDDNIKHAVKWANSLPCLRGKRYVPVVQKDRPGFIANRIQAPVAIYMNYLLDKCQAEGTPLLHLDNDLFTPISPMSPLVLYDYTGLDINYHTALYYQKMLHDDFKPGKVLSEHVEQGNLGVKTGQGFFKWEGRKPPVLDRTHKAHMVGLVEFAAIQANEGCRLLEEGVVKDWTTIDKTIEAGFNSPGPMQFLVDGNHDAWVKILNDLAEKTGKEYLRPCEMMKSGKYQELRYIP